MQRNLFPALLPLLAILLVLLGSCAGGGSGLSLDAASDSEIAAEAPAGGMPNLPAPSDLPRTASGLYAYERGTNYQNNLSALVADNGLMADFSPAYSGEGLDGLAYAVYVLMMKDYEGFGELEIKWESAPDEDDVYIGLSNYEDNRWKWLRPPSSFKLQIPDFEPYIKPNPDQRYMYIVVAVGGTEQCTLDLVRAGGNQAPIVKLDASKSLGPKPLNVEFDASASYDSGGEIATYEWDALGDGNFVEGGDVYNYIYNEFGAYPATLRVTDNEGNQTSVVHHIVVSGAQFDEVEHNDSYEEANQLPSGSFVGFHGTVGPAGAEDGDGEDYFKFNIESPTVVDLNLMFQHADANIDINVYEKTEDSSISVGNGFSLNDNEELKLSLMPGDYYMRIWNRDFLLNDLEKTSEYSLGITYTKTDAPYLNLVVEPTEGTVPWNLSIDSTDSADTGFGGIELYEYDLYGDGDFEYSSAFPGVRQYEIERVGTFNATVRITDTDGFQLTKSIEFISHGPANDEVEPNNNNDEAQPMEFQTQDFKGDAGHSATGADDVKDIYSFTAEEQVSMGFYLEYDGTHADLRLALYRWDGLTWVHVDGSNGGNGSEAVETTLQDGSEYRLHVTCASGGSAYLLDVLYM